jgi:hypothetical protein
MTWRKLLLVNLALVTVLAWGALRLRASWQHFEATHQVAAIQAEAEPVRAIPASTLLTAPAEDWTEISIKNPFSFDRNDVSIVAAAQAAPTAGKPVLYGTMSIGNERIAMLAAAQSSNRAALPLKVGGTVDSWQVVEILDKSVVLVAANGARETIVMNPTAQAPRQFERTTGTGPAPAALNVVAAAPTPPATTSSNAPAMAPSAQPAAANGADDEWLITPFGKVKRTR